MNEVKTETQEEINDEDDTTHATVQWFESLELAKQAIKDHEIETLCKYNFLRSSTYDSQHRIRWDADCIPYVIQRSYKFECQHGKNRNKINNTKRQSAVFSERKKTYNCVKESIKKDCPASVTIREAFKFPNFQSAGSMQQMDAAVINRIKMLVAQGVKSIPLIKENLKKFVLEELFKDKPPPALTNRRFFPTDKNIRNHCYSAAVRLGKQSIPDDEFLLETVKPDIYNNNMVNIIIESTEVVDTNQTARLLELVDLIKDAIHGVTSVDTLVQAEVLLQQTLQLVQSSHENTESTLCNQTGSLNKKRKLPTDTESTNDQQLKRRRSETILRNRSDEDRLQQPLDIQTTSSESGNAIVPYVIGGSIEHTMEGTSLSKVLLDIKVSDPSQELLKIGPYTITYGQLLTLESELSITEYESALAHDHHLTIGWLSDAIINSYLWQLCSSYDHVIYADTNIAEVMKHGGSIGQLWQNGNLNDKALAFIPWNPRGLHWVLLVIDIKQHKLLYLDPNQSDDNNRNKDMYKAKSVIEKSLMNKFNFSLSSIATNSNKTSQNDNFNCGVYICMYALWLTKGMNLIQPNKPHLYRRQIFNTIIGHCSLSVENKDICKVCQFDVKDNISTALEWVQCFACKQWYHSRCVGLSDDQVLCNFNFVCPEICYC
uniref:uncharacterized protein LOC100185158 isoform X2 n=1 Tax=Ciona intestinalis TaxID=7719 RepID=UPI000EF45D48|nr:uncharacterized protein LOC100185158 isoform X2 [Ciona intestinalis]|eukprot:XP_026691884.1 uncharacterized protein LOC100185158 isoform X2 [Ciona intestinalis]